MAEEVAIGAQMDRILRRITADLGVAGPRAVNAGAQKLATYARAAARGRSYGDTRGKHIPQSIVVRRAVDRVWPPMARVFLDTQKVPHAAFVHENYNGYDIRPKVKKYLWVPLTPAGRRHELYAEDSVEKRLKGFIPSTRKAVGYWGEDNKGKELDFVLVKRLQIPPNPRAGFLTRTAVKVRADIVREMRRAVIEQLRTGR